MGIQRKSLKTRPRSNMGKTKKVEQKNKYNCAIWTEKVKTIQSRRKNMSKGTEVERSTQSLGRKSALVRLKPWV